VDQSYAVTGLISTLGVFINNSTIQAYNSPVILGRHDNTAGVMGERDSVTKTFSVSRGGLFSSKQVMFV
jgi:hypothetical protein